MDNDCVCFAFPTNVEGIVNAVDRDFETVFLQDDCIGHPVQVDKRISFDLRYGHGVIDKNGIGDL